MNETNGAWGTATEVAGNLNNGGTGQLSSVSCASAASCSAGGYYFDTNSFQQAFIVNKS